MAERTLDGEDRSERIGGRGKADGKIHHRGTRERVNSGHGEMRDLKEIDEFLDGQACLADQRPQSSLREFLVVGHGETPVGRLGVTKDHVASLLHIDFITEAAEGFHGLRPRASGTG